MTASSFVPDPSWPTIEELAIEVWGLPTARHGGEVFFGTNEARKVDPKDNTWMDFEANQGGGYFGMWRLARGNVPLPPRSGRTASPGASHAASKSNGGHPPPGASEAAPAASGGPAPVESKGPPPWEDVGRVYRYLDAAGQLVLEVVRTLSGSPKFRQRRPDPTTRSGWRWNLKGIKPADRPLYRLPELLGSGNTVVWLPEGEKDVENLRDVLDLIATCNIGGAGKWRDEYNHHFSNRDVVVLSDNDPQAKHPTTGALRWHPDGRPVLPGQDHAATVATALTGIARSVRVLMPPGLPLKGDVSDWIEAGGTALQLLALAHETPEFVPTRTKSTPSSANGPGSPLQGDNTGGAGDGSGGGGTGGNGQEPPPSSDEAEAAWRDTDPDRARDGGGDPRPEPPPPGSNSSPDGDEIQVVPAIISEIEEIPPRPWAYGHFLMFGTAAVIGAMDGAGKGMIAVGIALAFITGEKLLGEHVWRTGRVVILTYEDDEKEWRRRIAAACLLHNLDYKTVLRGIHFLVRPNGRRVILAERSTGRDATVIFPDHDRIVAQLKALDTALFIIDPFNNAHTLDDGNNNALIASVAHEISTIARDADVAVLLLHHLRKGAVGSIDDLMGAVALRANFRACRIMQVMLAEMAEYLGIPTTEAWRYLRVVGSKENHAPPLDRSMWFHKASLKLNNPAGIYTNGDEVGAIERWEPPAMFEGLDYAKLRMVFDALAARPHSPLKQTKAIPWAGRPLLDLGKTEAQATSILAQWLKNGVVVHGEPFKTDERREIQTVTPVAAKVAEILEPLKPPEGAGEPPDA